MVIRRAYCWLEERIEWVGGIDGVRGRVWVGTGEDGGGEVLILAVSFLSFDIDFFYQHLSIPAFINTLDFKDRQLILPAIIISI